MSAAQQFVGLDIGSREHAVHLIEGTRERRFVTTNTVAGNRRLVQRLKAGHSRVVMEATGSYYLDTALDLVEAGIEVMVINPKHAHHFAKALGLRSSTDPISARMLAEFAQRMPFQRWQVPPQNWLQLRAFARQIKRLGELIAQAKNRLHAHQTSRRTPRALLQDERQGIRQLQRRKDRLVAAAKDLIAGDAHLHHLAECFMNATGIAWETSIALLGELLLLPRSMNARQCASHAGLDVTIKRSGISVESKPRISKQGNAYLRAALYMPVQSAVRHDPRVKAHYRQLQQRGKTKMQAIVAIMRKYLTGLWAAMKSEQPFDSARLFAQPTTSYVDQAA